MKLELEKPDSKICIKYYKPKSLKLSNGHFRNSIIFNKDSIINNNWPITHANQLNAQHFINIIQKNVNIYILGTGEQLIIPAPEIIAMFARAGKTLDFMTSSAACRTFNILANDGRNIIAAIIC